MLFARKSVSIGMAFAAMLDVTSPSLHRHILYGTMLKHQPSKMQAAEGFWEQQSQSPAPYYWIIVPDQATRAHRWRSASPISAVSGLLQACMDGSKGLAEYAARRQPAMGVVFYGFLDHVRHRDPDVRHGCRFARLRLHGGLFTTRWFLRSLSYRAFQASSRRWEALVPSPRRADSPGSSLDCCAQRIAVSPVSFLGNSHYS